MNALQCGPTYGQWKHSLWRRTNVSRYCAFSSECPCIDSRTRIALFSRFPSWRIRSSYKYKCKCIGIVAGIWWIVNLHTLDISTSIVYIIVECNMFQQTIISNIISSECRSIIITKYGTSWILPVAIWLIWYITYCTNIPCFMQGLADCMYVGKLIRTKHNRHEHDSIQFHICILPELLARAAFVRNIQPEIEWQFFLAFIFLLSLTFDSIQLWYAYGECPCIIIMAWLCVPGLF